MSTFYMRDEDFVLGRAIEHGCPCCGELIVPKDENNRDGQWQHEYSVMRNPDYHAAGEPCPEGNDIDSPICKIEFLLAFEDHTWETTIQEVPCILHHDKCTDEDRVEWAKKVLGTRALYSNVVLFAVYSLGPF